MSDTLMKEQIDEMLGETPVDGDEEFVDPTTNTEVETGSVESDSASVEAGTVTASDGGSNADGSGDGDTLSATDTVPAGGEPAAGEGDEGIVEDIIALRKRIADMSAAPVVPSVEDEVNPLDIFNEDVEYITEESLAEIADNPLLLNAAMNNVRKQTAENILNVVPVLIGKAITAHTKRMELHNSFYGANPELAPYKAYVSSVTKDVVTKNPDKSQEEILAIVAKSVKTSLRLDSQKSETKNNKGGAKPALRKPGGGGKTAAPAVDPNSTAAQILELL